MRRNEMHEKNETWVKNETRDEMRRMTEMRRGTKMPVRREFMYSLGNQVKDCM
jgi:hypothetical protein